MIWIRAEARKLYSCEAGSGSRGLAAAYARALYTDISARALYTDISARALYTDISARALYTDISGVRHEAQLNSLILCMTLSVDLMYQRWYTPKASFVPCPL